MAGQNKYQLLQKLAEDRQEQAAERLRRAKQRVNDAQHKLRQLEAYRDEYRQQLVTRSRSGMLAAQWAEFCQFIKRLDDAVAQQLLEVQRYEQQQQLEMRGWQEERKRAMAFDKLMDREDRKAQLKEGKRQQKLADEFATRQFWQRHHGGEETG